jgi:hypothetical protein
MLSCGQQCLEAVPPWPLPAFVEGVVDCFADGREEPVGHPHIRLVFTLADVLAEAGCQLRVDHSLARM